MNRYFSFLLAATFSLASFSSARAQTATPATTTILDVAPVADNIEGTVELRRYGFVQRAQIKFRAPDSLYVHIIGDAAHLAADEVYVAQSSTQTTYSADLKRVRQWRWSSVREPWRSQALADAGPANIWLWGWKSAQIAPFYSISTTKNTDATTIVLNAKASRARWVRDSLRSGGSGERLFYAMFKRQVFDWPKRVTLKLNAAQKPTFLEKRDERNRVLETTAFTWSAQNWPLSATTRDANNHIVAQWKYDLKAAAKPFADDDFSLEKATNGASKTQIVEDVEPLPLNDYLQKNDADSVFNRGVVQAIHVEDFNAAFNDWGAASAKKPQAVAPLETAFDNAISLRDWPRASRILQPLSALLPNNDAALLQRQTNLALQRRDWKSALAALNATEKARPNNLGVRLQRANLLRLGGDFSGAKQILMAIIAVPNAQSAGQSDAFGDWAQAAAAQLLAQMASVPSWREAANLDWQKLQDLPRPTTFQRLTIALLSFQLGENNASEKPAVFDNDAAQIAWARAQTAAGKVAEAIASWQVVARRASQPNAIQAHRNLMSLQANRGDVSKSLIEYSIVLSADLDEDARAFSRQSLFEAWRKAGKTDVLQRELRARSAAQNATDDDARLWLSWQEANASSKAVGETVRVFSGRFAKNAWWQSRLGEQLASEAAALDKKDDLGKTRLTSQALASIRRAIALDATQPYYAIQAAVILTLRANDFRKAAVSDALSPVEAANMARAELNSLLQKYPNDGDISIAVAFAGQALSANYPNVVTLLQNGLNGGLARRDSANGDRHATSFAARQALAIALRRQGQGAAATQQWQTLMTGARDSSESLGIAVNLLSVLKNAQSATVKPDESSTGKGKIAPSSSLANGAAQLLARLSSDAFSLEQSDGATRAFCTILQNDADLWPQVAAVLLVSKTPESQLGAAYFFFSLENTLSSMAKNPRNNAAMQTYLDDLVSRARLWSENAETKLAPIAEGSDTILAPRAASLLGGRALSRGDFSGAISRLQAATQNEPDSLELRLALSRAQIAAGANAAGQNDDATQTRDALVLAISGSAATDTATLNRAAALSAKLKQTDDALSFYRMAWNESVAPEVSTEESQRAGLGLARTLIIKGRLAESKELYNALSSTGSDFVVRVAALLDEEAQLRQAGKNADADQAKTQLAALKPSATDLQRAQVFLSSLDF